MIDQGFEFELNITVIHTSLHCQAVISDLSTSTYNTQVFLTTVKHKQHNMSKTLQKHLQRHIYGNHRSEIVYTLGVQNIPDSQCF